MPEILSYKNPDGTQSYRFKKGIEFRKHIPKALAGTLAAGAIGLIVLQYQDGRAQTPNLPNIPTSSTPEPTIKPTLIIEVHTPTPIPPTETPIPTITPYPTPTRVPTATPTRVPETQTPTPTPEPTPTPRPTPTPEPTPTPTLVPPTVIPTPAPTQLPPPTPIGISISEMEIGTERKFTECFDNSSVPTARASIDIETTEIEINHVKFKGDEEYLKTEIKVPKTKKEIEDETEKAKKKAKKEGKDPNTIVIDAEKIVSDGTAFDVDQNSICAKLKVKIRSGSDRDCYGNVSVNFKNRARGFNRKLLDKKPLLSEFCISGVLEEKFEPSGYEYNPITNTATAVLKIKNPDHDTSQETTVKLVKPCSLLDDAASQKIVDNATNKPVSLDEPLIIPPKESLWLRITSRMPFGQSPTFPLECNAELNRILEE